MMKVLEVAIEKLKALPEDKQRYAAEVIEHIASGDEVYEIPPEDLPLVMEAYERAQAGEFASDEEVERVLHRPWA
jgi:hypothetical protein